MDPPDDGVSGRKAAPKRAGAGGNGYGDGWREDNQGDEQTLTFNQHQEEDAANDIFTQKMLEQLEAQVGPDSNKAVEVDEQVLMHMRYEEVFIVDYSKLCPSRPRRFFKNMVPDVPITMCEHCCKFFLQDEYEFAYIEKGHCPFCKHVEKDKGVKNVYGSLADMTNWTDWYIN
jgi:intraflagellar transport protein 122